MSTSYCPNCEQIVEGHTFAQMVDGINTQTCEWCGSETVELPEEDESGEY